MTTRNWNQTLIAAALISATTLVQAGPRFEHESLVRAKVVSSEPVYVTVNEPRTQCWTESTGYEAPRYREGNGGAVLGAIAGGLIGSTVGKGNGRIAAAAVGAATGAVVGDRLGHRHAGGSSQVERCQSTDSYRRVIDGYDVRYRYQGREYSTQMPYDPGRFVNLRVSVAVAEDSRDGRWYRNDDSADRRDDSDR